MELNVAVLAGHVTTCMSASCRDIAIALEDLNMLTLAAKVRYTLNMYQLSTSLSCSNSTANVVMFRIKPSVPTILLLVKMYSLTT